MLKLKSIGAVELRKVSKEDDMQSVNEVSEAPVEYPEPEGSWIQITFTLDPEHYKMLWEQAEQARLTVSSFVRQKIMDSLEG